MATIVFNRMGDLVTQFILGNSGSITPPSSWTMGLSVSAVGSGSNMGRNGTWNASNTPPNFGELGVTPAGYTRPSLARTLAGGGADWNANAADNTFSTGGTSSTADQVTFGPFSGAGPSPNGANSWVLTDGSTVNAGQVYFAADTAATRTFASGDTEKVTATLKAG